MALMCVLFMNFRYLCVYVWRELLRVVVVERDHLFDRHVGVNITPPVRPTSMRDWTTTTATTNSATFTLESKIV